MLLPETQASHATDGWESWEPSASDGRERYLKYVLIDAAPESIGFIAGSYQLRRDGASSLLFHPVPESKVHGGFNADCDE